MCDQTEVQYLPGEVVWVKLRALWWPGLVQDYDSLPEEITSSLRKRPIATVKFFQEDSYEYVHKLDLIYHYNCSRKHEFIKKGIDLCRKKTADRPATMDFFPMDIVTAEELTHGDPNILQDEAFKPEEKPKYTSLFGSEKKKFGKKKGKEDSPLKDKVARRKKLTSKLQAMGWLSRGITANIIYPSPDIPRMVTHRRFLNKGRNPDAKSDYEVRIREQKCEDELRLEKTYECVLCGYETGRLNVIVLHFNNNHSQKTKNFFPTPSILKGGSFRNPLLKLKSEHRKSDSGKSSLLPKKRASLKAKVEKVKVEESDGDSSENEIVKPVPIKKEKGKPGRKRKIKPEEKDRPEEVKEVIKKPKVLDSLLADWDEDVEQEDDEVDSEKRQDDEDDNVSDVNASVDDDTGSAKDESSLVEDASSASKSKEVFEFDPDEDDNIDFDLTPNVKGFGRRIPRVIDSSKEKKQGVSAKKPSKGKGSKKVEDEEDDEFATLLAETSMPSLPSVPKASTFSMDTEDDLNPTFDKSQDETSSKSVLKEENKTEVVKEDEKEQKSKNSDPEVDLAVDSKNPPQGHEDKITAKVTVETVPDLAITSPEHNEDRLLSGDELPKSESKPGQSTSGGDHTYVSGGSARKRRRSLLPLEKGDSMAVPVVLDDEFPIEESPRVHKKPVLPSEPGQQPRRRGRPPKRGGGARSGGRGMKSAPPTKSPKSPPYQSPKSPPYQSPKSPSPHLSPAPLRGSKSPSPHAMSPPRYTGPKSPPLSQGSKSPQPQRSPKSPAEQTPKSPERTPKSPSNRQSSKSPSVQPSPKILPPMSPKSPMRSPVRSPEAYQGPKSPIPQSPKSPRSPQPYQSPSHQGPKSPQPLLSPKSPPALLSPKSPKPLEVKTIKSPLQSSMKKSTALSNPPALASIKSVVKSPQPSPSSQAIVVSSSTPMKSTAGKILTPVGKGGAVLKKVVTSNAVIVQSKPDLQPEACGLGKMIASPPSSAATSSSSAPAVKTIKLAVSGAPGSSPVVVSKAGTPGTPGTRKVMIVKGKGGTQQMVLPAEASQQLLSNIGTGKKIMVITKGAGGQQQKIMLTPQQQKLLTSGTSSAQIVTSKGTVLSSVAKLVSTKPSTSRASTGNIAGGLELSTEPPALVKTDSKKTYKIITSPQSKGNILLNTSGGQILLPVSSIAASGSGVTTASGSKQFILPVGAKNMKLLNAVSGSGQKVILQMKSSPAKVGAMATTKTIQPIVPKTMQSIASKTVQAISPKGLQTITQKTVQAISPKNVQPITPKGSTPVKVTKIATMVQPVPQLTPIGSPKTPRPQKQIKTVVAKQVKSAPPAKAPRKSNVLPKASIAASSSTTVVLPSTPNRNSGILPNPNLKPLVPQLKTSKKISLAAKPASVDSTPVSSMPGTVQVVTGSVPGLEPIQTTLVPSAETSSTVPLPTSTQQFITVPTDDGGQMMYLIDNSSLMNLEGSNPSNLQNIILTFDNMGQPVSSAGSDFTFAAPSSGQDILAEALANTLQPEASGGDLSLDTSGLLSSHTSSTIYQPTLSHGVLETSLTLNQPIMTPLEDLSAVSTLQPPPATGAATSVDIPSTITVPDITISTSSYSSLPIPSATIQSTVFSDVQHVTTFSTAAPADGNVFIEAPSTEGESFLSTDGVYEQSSEGASMPLLDG